MKAIDTLTDQQRANLAKLSAYLKGLPADYSHFDMGVYNSTDRKRATPRKCGTAACAAGHGPSAGIEPLPGEKWDMYVDRAFVPFDEGSEGFYWMFSGAWEATDPTHYGAAARIDWFLEKGVPADFEAQRFGTAPLCYK